MKTTTENYNWLYIDVYRQYDNYYIQLKDDRDSFDFHAKNTYYTSTGYGVLRFTDKTVHSNVTATRVSVAKRIIESVYQYLC